jgi:hypothetical protein
MSAVGGASGGVGSSNVAGSDSAGGGAAGTSKGGTNDAAGGSGGVGTGGSGTGGSGTGGYHPENFDVCKFPVVYRNDMPDSPTVKAFETQLGGEAGVIAAIEQLAPFACAVLFETPEQAGAIVHPSARLVLHFGPSSWSEEGWTDPASGKHYYDYPGGDFVGGPNSPDASVVSDVLGTMLHETTHLIDVGGNSDPKWIEEGYCDFVRLQKGYVSQDSRSNAQGQHWCDGYTAAAVFFDWLQANGHPHFMLDLSAFLVAHRNQAYPGGYPTNESNSEEVFSAVTGGTGLSALWDAYRKSVGGDPPVDCDDSMWKPY